MRARGEVGQVHSVRADPGGRVELPLGPQQGVRGDEDEVGLAGRLLVHRPDRGLELTSGSGGVVVDAVVHRQPLAEPADHVRQVRDRHVDNGILQPVSLHQPPDRPPRQEPVQRPDRTEPVERQLEQGGHREPSPGVAGPAGARGQLADDLPDVAL